MKTKVLTVLKRILAYFLVLVGLSILIFRYRPDHAGQYGQNGSGSEGAGRSGRGAEGRNALKRFIHSTVRALDRRHTRGVISENP